MIKFKSSRPGRSTFKPAQKSRASSSRPAQAAAKRAGKARGGGRR